MTTIFPENCKRYFPKERSKSHQNSLKPKITPVLVMPISGCHFVNQAAICKHLVQSKYCPDLILGTSGGCIVGSLLLACGIRDVKSQETYEIFEEKFNDILSKLSADQYRKEWASFSIASSVIALTKGSLFDRGTGVNFLQEYECNFENQPELIIGTHNQSQQCCYLFSTKTKETSLVPRYDESEQSGSLPPDPKYQEMVYLNHSLEDILLAATASCTVPTIVPPVKIDNEHYVDGGVSFASPLGPCMSTLFETLSYHVVYISPVRYSKDTEPEGDEMEDDNVWRKLSQSMIGMVTGLHISDRNNGIRMVCHGCDENHVQRTSGCGPDELERALKIQRHSIRSFIELAPLGKNRIDFLQMKCGEVLKEVNASYENGFSVNHWYISHR